MDNLDRNIPVNSENIGTDSDIAITPFDYGSNVWVINGTKSEKPYCCEFEDRFNPKSEWQISLAKAFVYSKCIEFNGILTSKNKVSTLTTKIKNITQLFANAEVCFGDKLLSEYQDLDLVKIGCLSNKEERAIVAHNTCRNRIGVLRSLYDLRLTNHLTDSNFLPLRRASDDWEQVVADNFAPEEFNLAEWVNGGSFDTVPFEVSLAILTYCIEQLRSPRLQYLLAWYDMLRSHDKNGYDFNHQTYDSLLKKFGNKHHWNALKIAEMDEHYFECLQQYFPECQTRSQLPLEGIPFTTGSIVKLTQFYRTVCYVSFIILTGMRDSEASGMRFDAIKRDGKNFVHYTPIVKTHDGVESGRPIGAALVSEIVHVMPKLGTEEYDQESRPHFFDVSIRNLKSKKCVNHSIVSNSMSNFALHAFYERFLEDHGEEMEQICPKITAHAFRHTWAEFTLRRFDGHIIPLIADHFRHAPGQFMNFTPAYTAAKLTADEYREIGNRYIFDIIDRYIVGAEDLYGAMGRFIKSMVDEKVEFIDIHDRDERARLIKDIQHAAGRREVNVDSKGICLVNLDTPEQANCTDAYGIPKTDEATADMCTACPMHCKTSSHVEKHKRLTMAYGLHAQQLKDEPILFALFGEEARKEHQIMLAAQKKMEA